MLSRKMWFKAIALVLIQAFLVLDIAWAGGTQIQPSKQADCLSPAVQLDTQLLIKNFQELYNLKLGNPGQKDTNLPDENPAPSRETETPQVLTKLRSLLKSMLLAIGIIPLFKKFIRNAGLLGKAAVFPISHYADKMRGLKELLDKGIAKINGIEGAMQFLTQGDETTDEAYRDTLRQIYKVKVEMVEGLTTCERNFEMFGDMSGFWKLANIDKIYTFLREMQDEEEFLTHWLRSIDGKIRGLKKMLVLLKEVERQEIEAQILEQGLSDSDTEEFYQGLDDYDVSITALDNLLEEDAHDAEFQGLGISDDKSGKFALFLLDLAKDAARADDQIIESKIDLAKAERYKVISVPELNTSRIRRWLHSYRKLLGVISAALFLACFDPNNRLYSGAYIVISALLGGVALAGIVIYSFLKPIKQQQIDIFGFKKGELAEFGGGLLVELEDGILAVAVEEGNEEALKHAIAEYLARKSEKANDFDFYHDQALKIAQRLKTKDITVTKDIGMDEHSGETGFVLMATVVAPNNDIEKIKELRQQIIRIEEHIRTLRDMEEGGGISGRSGLVTREERIENLAAILVAKQLMLAEWLHAENGVYIDELEVEDTLALRQKLEELIPQIPAQAEILVADKERLDQIEETLSRVSNLIRDAGLEIEHRDTLKKVTGLEIILNARREKLERNPEYDEKVNRFIQHIAGIRQVKHNPAELWKAIRDLQVADEAGEVIIIYNDNGAEVKGILPLDKQLDEMRTFGDLIEYRLRYGHGAKVVCLTEETFDLLQRAFELYRIALSINAITEKDLMLKHTLRYAGEKEEIEGLYDQLRQLMSKSVPGTAGEDTTVTVKLTEEIGAAAQVSELVMQSI